MPNCRIPVLGLALAAWLLPVAADAETGCAMSEADRAWLQQALAQWQATETGVLALAPQPLPQVIAVDAACTYTLPAGDISALTGTAHGETVTFPDGGEAPLGPISFASGESGYFAMSLPSVWRAAGVDSEFGLERMMTGVLLHEMMHIRQTGLARQGLAGAVAAAGIPDDDLTDDIVQHRFADDPAYVAAYSAERDALFAAAAAPDDAAARALAAQALALMRERRARWFVGDRAGFAAMDDVFLTMEGMGQLLIYRYFRSPAGGGADAAAALKGVRRGGKWWSQDEGLGLMLVVDRLLPGWQQRAFRDPDWRAENLLAAAAAAQ
jgi:hypothetical protein